MRRSAVRHLHAGNDSGCVSSVAARSLIPRWRRSAKGFREIFAAAPATFRFRSRGGSGAAQGHDMRSNPGRIPIGCARQLAGRGVAAGGRTRRMAADRRRHGCNGAVCGGKTSGAKAGQHLESSRAAAY